MSELSTISSSKKTNLRFPWNEIVLWAGCDHNITNEMLEKEFKQIIGDPNSFFLASGLIVVDPSYKIEDNPSHLNWAESLLRDYKDSLGATRYHLVPRRMSEDGFWCVLWTLVRQLVQTLASRA